MPSAFFGALPASAEEGSPQNRHAVHQRTLTANTRKFHNCTHYYHDGIHRGTEARHNGRARAESMTLAKLCFAAILFAFALSSAARAADGNGTAAGPEPGKADGFSWVVKDSGEFSLRQGQPIEVSIAVTGAAAATNVRLLRAVFIKDPSKTLMRGSWRLCAAADDCQPGRIIASLAANSANRLWLRPPDEGFIGKYTGTVIVGSAQDPAGQ